MCFPFLSNCGENDVYQIFMYDEYLYHKNIWKSIKIHVFIFVWIKDNFCDRNNTSGVTEMDC